MNEHEKEQLLMRLSGRIGGPDGEQGHECPICRTFDWVIADDLSTIQLQPNLNMLNLGGPAIPVIIIICKKCGFVALHASKILGGFPKDAPPGPTP